VEDTYNKLLKNKKKIKNIIPVNKGFYKENCRKEINIFKSDEHSSLFDIEAMENDRRKKLSIDLISGDSFIKENNINSVDFLKLDIEGAEYDALLGFEECLAAHKIRAVQFEYGYINITTKKLLIDYYSLLESHQYIIGKIFPKSVEFRKYDYKYEDFIGPNFIAVRKNDKELIESLQKK
jgi:FkbM family methyltransferase